jgi:hypothetical protein
MDCGLRLKRSFRPPSGSGTGLKYLYEWKKNKQWNQIIFEVNGESKALLEKLTAKGYKETQHWNILEDENGKKYIEFPFPVGCIELINNSSTNKQY